MREKQDPLNSNIKYELLAFTNIRSSDPAAELVLARQRNTGRRVTIKFFPRGPGVKLGSFQRDIMMYASLRHHHIARFKEAVLTETQLGLVSDFVHGTDLLRYCCQKGRIFETEARQYMQQILLALSYVQKTGLTNWMLGLEKIVLDKRSGIIKLTDLVPFQLPEWEDCVPDMEELLYSAPEVLEGWPSGKQRGTTPAKVWSAGVCLHVMLYGSYPFGALDGVEGYAALTELRSRTREYASPENIPISDACRDFLHGCFRPDAEERLSLEEAVCHPWLQGTVQKGKSETAYESRKLVKASARVSKFQGKTSYFSKHREASKSM